MTPPSAYESLHVTTGLYHAMKSKKRMHGLRQSLRNWLNTVEDSLKETGSTAIISDPCVYTLWRQHRSSTHRRKQHLQLAHETNHPTLLLP